MRWWHTRSLHIRADAFGMHLSAEMEGHTITARLTHMDMDGHTVTARPHLRDTVVSAYN